MKKSTLTVIRKNNKLIIKKNIDAMTCIIYVIMLICIMAFLLTLEIAGDIQFFWLGCFFFIGSSFIVFFRDFWGKLVIDTEARMLFVYDWCKESYSLDEIKEVKSFFKESDSDGGSDTNKLVIVMKDHQIAELHTTSQKQSKELVTLLQPILLSHQQEKSDS